MQKMPVNTLPRLSITLDICRSIWSHRNYLVTWQCALELSHVSSTSYRSLRFQKVEQLRGVPTNGTKPQTLESKRPFLPFSFAKDMHKESKEHLPSFVCFFCTTLPSNSPIFGFIPVIQFKKQAIPFIQNLYDLLQNILGSPVTMNPLGIDE